MQNRDFERDGKKRRINSLPPRLFPYNFPVPPARNFGRAGFPPPPPPPPAFFGQEFEEDEFDEEDIVEEDGSFEFENPPYEEDEFDAQDRLPPPPYRPFAGRPPFPPARNFGRAGFPPPPPPPPAFFGQEFEEDEFDEEDIVEEDGSFEFENPPYEEDEFDAQADENSDISRIKISSLVQNEALLEMQKTGEQKAAINQDRELFARVFKITFKVLVVVGILIGVLFVGERCLNYYQQRHKTNMEALVASGKENAQSSAETLFKLNPDSMEGKIIHLFYSQLGDFDRIANMTFVMHRGTVEIGGKTKEFQCIKKNTGETFMRLGSDSADGAYLISSFDEPSKRLYDGTLSGRQAELSLDEENLLRPLSMYDEVLFVRTFSSLTKVSRAPLKYVGEKSVDGVQTNVISVEESSATFLEYYFDEETSLIRRIKMENPAGKITIDFSDYTLGDGDYKYPKVRTIYIDGKLFAKVVVDFVVSNKWMFFPR